jgi:ParD-like antitoxin of type II bacterial toxin-antitoxin system
MSQPVKVSDNLVLDARLMGAAAQRSIAGQIEFWAGLGRTLERLLRGDQVLALCRAGQVKPLSACLKSIDSDAGHLRLTEHLRSRPYPHYEPDSRSAGLLVRIEANGKRTTGKFINRKFVPVKASKP